MVAALKDMPSASLPLLCEPDPPGKGVRRLQGWRIIADRTGFLERFTSNRKHEDDAGGAAAQWIIVRYALRGERRKALSIEFAYGERFVSAILCGERWSAYGLPIIRELHAMGIRTTRASLMHDAIGARAREIIEAQRLLISLALPYIPEGHAATERLRFRARLLAFTLDDEVTP